nr:YadA C-terminal domain-containing protein [Burkholderia cepacia]
MNQLSSVQSNIDQVARRAYSGVAAATALAMIPGSRPGDVLTLGIGAATYQGYQAVAIGGSALLNRALEVKTGVGFNSNGIVAGVGAGYHW